MPLWTCLKCGHSEEFHGGKRPPWKSHTCMPRGKQRQKQAVLGLRKFLDEVISKRPDIGDSHSICYGVDSSHKKELV